MWIPSDVEFEGEKLVDEEALHVALNDAVFRGGSVSKSGSKPNLIQLQLQSKRPQKKVRFFVLMQ
jgi:hypothetical protein